jgi:hypothetical protein
MNGKVRGVGECGGDIAAFDHGDEVEKGIFDHILHMGLPSRDAKRILTPFIGGSSCRP